MYISFGENMFVFCFMLDMGPCTNVANVLKRPGELLSATSASLSARYDCSVFTAKPTERGHVLTIQSFILLMINNAR